MAVSGVSSSQPEPEEVEGGAVSPLLGVFLGVVGVLLLLAAAAIFITRRHCSRNPGRTPDLVAGQGEFRWCVEVSPGGMFDPGDGLR